MGVEIGLGPNKSHSLSPMCISFDKWKYSKLKKYLGTLRSLSLNLDFKYGFTSVAIWIAELAITMLSIYTSRAMKPPSIYTSRAFCELGVSLHNLIKITIQKSDVQLREMLPFGNALIIVCLAVGL